MLDNPTTMVQGLLQVRSNPGDFPAAARPMFLKVSDLQEGGKG